MATRSEIIKSMVGKRFNKLLVLTVSEKPYGYKSKGLYFLCRCDCLKEKVVNIYGLKRGTTRSCGCFAKEIRIKTGTKNLTTHGLSKSSTYMIWQSMRKRCENNNCRTFKNYGGRGITVCERWIKFENFLEDMGLRPNGLCLDRIDNNKGYSKENCRWTTYTEQANNKRSNRVVTVDGVSHTVAEWSRILNIKKPTISARLNAFKMSYREALFRKRHSKGREFK